MNTCRWPWVPVLSLGVVFGCGSQSVPAPGDVDGSGGRSGPNRPDGSGGRGTVEVPKGPLENCGFDPPAFCEDFEKASPGGRGGDLDEKKWAFSRWGHDWGDFFQRNPASTLHELEGRPVLFPATFCGEEFSGILPPNDVRICDGPGPFGTTSKQLNEVFTDMGDFGFNSMMIRQPFDFAGRTGRIVWEVDAKINPYNIGHGWWFEIWITEDPSPMPYHGAPTVLSYPRNGIGLALQFAKGCEQSEDHWQNMVETVHIIQNHQVVRARDDVEPWGQCFKVADAKLNRFELDISKDRFVFRASDYDNPALTYEVYMDDLELPFERGYVHFQHAQYNAHKDGDASPVQTFRWDNIGFDGPVLPVVRAFEATDTWEKKKAGVALGKDLSEGDIGSFTIPGVDLSDAKVAKLALNALAAYGQTLEYRLNRGAWHGYDMPLTGTEEDEATESLLKSVLFEVPLEELVEGSNTVDFRFQKLIFAEGVTNVELLVETD